MPIPLSISKGGVQLDRYRYVTTEPTTGYEPAAGALITSKPTILMSCYIGISPNLAGTIFIHFYDSNAVVGAGGNVATWTLASEPLATASGTFIWQPGSAEAVQYQYPKQRLNPTCQNPNLKGENLSEILGFPFDNGLFIVASTTKSQLTLAAANMIRITAFIRSPAEQNG